jgi:hypothetical protein
MRDADHWGTTWIDPDQALPDLAWALRTAAQLRADLDRMLLAVSEGRLSASLVTDHLAAFAAISQYGVELQTGWVHDPPAGRLSGLVAVEDGAPAPHADRWRGGGA